MGSDNGISSDEITEEERKELEQYEKWMKDFRIKGAGMSGNTTDGFEYESP